MHADQTFVMSHRTEGREVSRQLFEKCFFDNCSIRSASVAAVCIREIEVRNCRHRASSIRNAILEDVLVDGLRGEGDIPLFLQGVVFRRVTLRGRITQFKINPTSTIVSWSSPEATRALADQHKVYEKVDWALDIRDAEFTFGPDLHFIPGLLVRFDPETQALVRRKDLAAVELHSLPWGTSALEIGLQWFVESSPYDETVIVAPKKGKGFRKDLAAIQMLRDRGLAAPASHPSAPNSALQPTPTSAT